MAHFQCQDQYIAYLELMPENHKMFTYHWTRRDILKAGAAGLALPALLPGHGAGRNSTTPPSESVKIGVIGCGGRAGVVNEGRGVKGFHPASCCDCEPQKAARFAAKVGSGQNWTPYEDFRRMIDKEKLDAVMVETTTHARAWIDGAGHAGRRRRVHREAHVPDDLRRPGDGQGRAGSSAA